jgi:hypothetical protein
MLIFSGILGKSWRLKLSHNAAELTHFPKRTQVQRKNDNHIGSRPNHFETLHSSHCILHCLADGREINPLELLRFERDLAARCKLLTSLDSRWSTCAESYCPTEVEELIINELGVDRNSVMMLAISNANGGPMLCSFDPASVKASISALKAANVDVSDIWFLSSKRPALLDLKEVLQRWLDFLMVYGLKDKGGLGLAVAPCCIGC